jgi:hypothetical protein
MMTSGFKESTSSIGQFEDADPDVFGGFYNFAN